MSATDYYKRRLLQEKERLVRLITSLEEGLEEGQGDAIQELSTYDNHPADLGSETYERSKDLGLREDNRLLLARVEEALRRIETGTYGYCENCGREIYPERLRAVPYTTLCLACKRKEEEVQHPFQARREGESLGQTLGETGENVAFDGEDSWQAVARYNKLPEVVYGEEGEGVERVEDLSTGDNRCLP